MELKGKKILLLVPFFYGYEKEIESKIRAHGGEVTRMNVNPPVFFSTLMNSLAMIGCPRRIWVRLFEVYTYIKIRHQKYDFVLVISGWAITSYITKKIRQNNLNKQGKMILYYWDSLERLKDDISRWSCFNYVYTFDKEDYLSHKDSLRFLPLFYCDKYWVKEKSNNKCDIMVIGSFRLNRLELIRKLRANNPSLKIESYLYAKKGVIIFQKLFRKKYNGVDYSEIKFKPLSNQEVVNLYKSSNAILDIPANGQSGLSIRTFETLALHKKLITSNIDIKTYAIYSPEDIYLISDDSLQLPSKDWFDKQFSLSDDIIKQHSIGSWLNTLFLNEDK